MHDIKAIRDNPAPYGQIQQIEPLIATDRSTSSGIG